MKILKQSPIFFSILGIMVLLYISQGVLLPEDFQWPGILNLKANVLESIPNEIELIEVKDEPNWPRAEVNSNIPGCAFHIYDKSGNIHCSTTYEGHLGNIKRYLR